MTRVDQARAEPAPAPGGIDRHAPQHADMLLLQSGLPVETGGADDPAGGEGREDRVGTVTADAVAEMLEGPHGVLLVARAEGCRGLRQGGEAKFAIVGCIVRAEPPD